MSLRKSDLKKIPKELENIVKDYIKDLFYNATDLSLKRICKECGNPLRVIGKNRRNGNYYQQDWNTRAYHKKCYKMLMNDCRYTNYIKSKSDNNTSLRQFLNR